MKMDLDDINHNKTFLLDNIYAALVTQIALTIQQTEGDKYKTFEPYVDKAVKLVKQTKFRVHETYIEKDFYF
jgi:hypothetical protein